MLAKSGTVNQWQSWLNVKMPWFLLQTLLHIISYLICVLLLPSLSHKVTLFQLYKPRMNNLFRYFNYVGYFLFPGGRWQILVFIIRIPCACLQIFTSYQSEYTLLKCSHVSSSRGTSGCRSQDLPQHWRCQQQHLFQDFHSSWNNGKVISSST